MTAEYIALAGEAKAGLGIALWQADGSGPEPAATGHTFDTPIGRIYSHYYIASREYAGIDPHARGALAACEPLRGFARLAAALREHALRPDDIVIRLPLTTPGADREGVDWSYRDGVETRCLFPTAPVPLLIRGEPALRFALTRLMLVEDYRGAATFADARLSLASDPFAIDLIPGADGVAASVARALLDDLNGRRLRFNADRVVLLPDEFGGNGRFRGYFAEIPTARLEIMAT